jgi:hypothetical protein
MVTKAFIRGGATTLIAGPFGEGYAPRLQSGVEPMRYAVPAALLLLTLTLPANAAEVAVSRFHTAESLGAAAPGPIAVRAGAGLEADSLEARAWVDAVAAALSRQGFTVVPEASRVALVSLDRVRVEGDRARGGSGVSVGIGVGSGGHYGGWGRGGGGIDLGVGLGLLLGGRPRASYATTLAVTIEDAAGAHAWEGRAEATVREPSRKDDPRTLADEMAGKLFAGFPGESGATIGAR